MKQCAVLFFAVISLVATVLADSPAVMTSFCETNVLCIRVSRVTENFEEQLRAAEPTNPIAGTILDLRFADGSNAVATDCFTRKKSPLVILVNSQTRGAAAALAAQLRASAPAILIGSPNSPEKIAPDVTVAVSVEDERKFQENPYALSGTNRAVLLSGTNNLLAFVDHMSEAELVRKRIKDGEDGGDVPTPRAAPAQPVIRDPALARAADLLKALSVLHKPRG